MFSVFVGDYILIFVLLIIHSLAMYVGQCAYILNNILNTHIKLVSICI